jgi:hypothetical protein
MHKPNITASFKSHCKKRRTNLVSGNHAFASGASKLPLLVEFSLDATHAKLVAAFVSRINQKHLIRQIGDGVLPFSALDTSVDDVFFREVHLRTKVCSICDCTEVTSSREMSNFICLCVFYNDTLRKRRST